MSRQRISSHGITRRDLFHGLAWAGAGALVPGRALADAVDAMTATGAAPYPPGLTGMRGNHPGSWEVAHQLARAGQRDFGPSRPASVQEASQIYDLVVVGAGISGLAAAYFFLKEQPNARILLLENHDDFGGHAKRNEFEVNGKTLLGYGGSQSFEAPRAYSDVVKGLLRELSIDTQAFETAYDHGFYERNALQGGVFFNRRDWGESRMVKLDIGGLRDYLPLAPGTLSTRDAVAQMPLSASARAQLLRLLTETRDCMAEVPLDAKRDYLYTISYREFLERHLGITAPEVFRVLDDLAADSGVGIAAAIADDAIFYSVLPGRAATGVPPHEDAFEPYIHHFPDGNASVARLLVRRMIPRVAPGEDMYDVVQAPFDYTKLDEPDALVRLRLNSTVVNVQHVGSARGSREVRVSYVNNGASHTVRAAQVVMACYHAIIPAICPELPKRQRDAMAKQVKVPILYTNVALRNWEAWKAMGIGGFVAPGCYHVNAMLDFPVSLGGYTHGRAAEDPAVVHMERFPHGSEPGLSTRERLRVGRRELLMTPFEEIEANIRQQLDEALSPGGFESARDIAGITVNRWAHGYSYDYSGLDDERYEEWDDPRYPHMRARKRHGRIAMANSDADANAMLESAIEQAHRAIAELLAS